MGSMCSTLSNIEHLYRNDEGSQLVTQINRNTDKREITDVTQHQDRNCFLPLISSKQTWLQNMDNTEDAIQCSASDLNSAI